MDMNIEAEEYYDRPHPGFKKPVRVGHFSLDGQRAFHDDDHQMKYIIRPPNPTNLNMDLSIGYTKAIKKCFDEREKISHLLKWILNHQEQIQTEFYSSVTKRTRLHFVCARGLLTRISATPYEKLEGWELCASKFQSIIYLSVFNTEENIQKRKVDQESYLRLLAWGPKFEQYMTADSKGAKPDISIPVNEREEFHIVLKGKMKEYTLLYNAEVDGKDPHCYDNDPRSTDCFVELKTSKIYENKQIRTLIRSKLIKWWLQSYIGGIPKLMCGLRDYDGFVKRIETFTVAEIPNMAKEFWSDKCCFNFCSEFLDFVKKTVEEDNPMVVYKFSWKPGQNTVRCEKLTSPGEYIVLPDWFTSQLRIQ